MCPIGSQRSFNWDISPQTPLKVSVFPPKGKWPKPLPANISATRSGTGLFQYFNNCKCHGSAYIPSQSTSENGVEAFVLAKNVVFAPFSAENRVNPENFDSDGQFCLLEVVNVNGCIWQRDPERTNWIGLLVGELQSFVDRNSGRNCGFECQHQVPIAVPFHKMACMRPPNLQHSFRSLMGRTFKGRTNQPPSESGQYSRFCLISPCNLGRSRL